MIQTVRIRFKGNIFEEVTKLSEIMNSRNVAEKMSNFLMYMGK